MTTRDEAKAQFQKALVELIPVGTDRKEIKATRLTFLSIEWYWSFGNQEIPPSLVHNPTNKYLNDLSDLAAETSKPSPISMKLPKGSDALRESLLILCADRRKRLSGCSQMSLAGYGKPIKSAAKSYRTVIAFLFLQHHARILSPKNKGELLDQCGKSVLHFASGLARINRRAPDDYHFTAEPNGSSFFSFAELADGISNARTDHVRLTSHPGENPQLL